MRKKNIILFTFLAIVLIANASKVSRGYKALNIYNYFEAKRLFEKAKKRHKAPAAYGLSIIYQRTDNPFHNIDSAYVNIMYALKNYSNLKLKKKIKYQKYGIDSLALIKQRNLITKKLYKRAIDVNSVFGFQDFIDKNPWSKFLDTAIFKRDSLFFYEKHQLGRSIDYVEFLNKYPNSVYASKAKKLSNQTFYLEQTKSGKIEAYETFIKSNPNSKYVLDAQDKIYKIFTKTKTTKTLSDFVSKYPNNKNTNKAWLELYEYTLQKKYNKSQLQQFLNQYPNYPFKSDLIDEIEMFDVNFLIIKQNSKWGFISENGQYIIEAKYSYVEPFSEGLALVANENNYYYITKKNKQKIKINADDAFPFKNGFAIVEVNEKYGLINRVGEYVIKPKYTDLGNVSENVLYFEKDNKYGYFNTNGNEYLKNVFKQANDYKNDKAIVKIRKNEFNIINKFGDNLFNHNFNEIKQISDTIFVVKQNNKWGVITPKSDTLIPFKYNYIKKSIHNWFLVEQNNTFNFINIKTQDTLSKKWFNVYSEYKQLATFNKGFAKVKTDNGFNFVGLNGELLLNKQYSNLDDYNTNIAFKSKDKWGYILRSNKIIIKPKFDKAFSFNKTVGKVIINNKYGLINLNGNMILDTLYDDISILNDTLFIVNQNQKYGLISVKNEVIIPLDNKLIEPYSNSVVKIVNNKAQFYYNFEKNKWIGKK